MPGLQDLPGIRGRGKETEKVACLWGAGERFRKIKRKYGVSYTIQA